MRNAIGCALYPDVDLGGDLWEPQPVWPSADEGQEKKAKRRWPPKR
jgi:hypothetical protein